MFAFILLGMHCMYAICTRQEHFFFSFDDFQEAVVYFKNGSQFREK